MIVNKIFTLILLNIFFSKTIYSFEILREGPYLSEELEQRVFKLFQNQHQNPIVVFDVDGTLTIFSTPNDRIKTKLDDDRKAVKRLALSLFKKGDITLIASSAWSSFPSRYERKDTVCYGTLDRIEGVGLNEVFQVQSNISENLDGSSHKKTLIKPSYSDEDLIIHQSGKAISVKKASSSDEFFRSKALAPYVDNENAKKSELVIFIDDSGLNLNLIEQEIRTLNLYPHAKVYLMLLESSGKESFWKKVLTHPNQASLKRCEIYFEETPDKSINAQKISLYYQKRGKFSCLPLSNNKKKERPPVDSCLKRTK